MSPHRILLMCVALAGLIVAQGTGTIEVAAFHPYPVMTGLFANDLPTTSTVTVAKLYSPGAPWMQVRFGDLTLVNGASVRVCTARECDTITGMTPGNPVTISRPLSGDLILVELVLPPASEGTVSMLGYDAAIPPQPISADSLCDLLLSEDHRVYSADSKVGRLRVSTATGVSIYTAFLVSDHVMLTAGHCLAGAQAILVEFNCPLSDPMGNLNPSQVVDQYQVVMSTVAAVNNGPCEDYGAFRCAANAFTGLAPGLVQSFDSTKPPPAPIYFVEINGFGPVVPQTGVNLIFNHTMRTDVDALVPAPPGCLWYEVDTNELGSDGAPVHDTFDEHVVGIHTTGGCNYTGVRNQGTPITNPGLVAMAASLGVTIPTPANPPIAPRIFMWQGAGAAPIYGQVAGVEPGSELFNVFSMIPAVPTGSGPFFGLIDGPGSGDPLAQALAPLGTQPFHVMANSEGRYLLFAPVGEPSQSFRIDLVSVILSPTGALSVSNVINVTIRL